MNTLHKMLVFMPHFEKRVFFSPPVFSCFFFFCLFQLFTGRAN